MYIVPRARLRCASSAPQRGLRFGLRIAHGMAACLMAWAGSSAAAQSPGPDGTDPVADQGIEPTCIKMDVEGAEFDVLQGGVDTLSRYRPSLFLATHGRDVHESTCRLLAEMEYRINVVDGRELAKARKLLALPA